MNTGRLLIFSEPWASAWRLDEYRPIINLERTVGYRPAAILFATINDTF
jgi:hypothetical protein